ncbi:hypothetical protein AAG570_001187 [Ranatra chinensis]|uniref:Peptidase S1 domain-containing protein n=1 Tax=Ranatra chinensis TaxID=642074 RepID=A0ABD0YB50_9HEMI
MKDDNINSDEHGKGPGSRHTNCSCGWTNKARVVGGKETIPNEYPLMAGLIQKKDNDIICGGAIITRRHAITAAHCTFGEKRTLALIAGEHDLTTNKETKRTKIYIVSQIIQHEQYDDDTCVFDISLLVVKRKMEFNEAVGPACLPSTPIDLSGQYVKVTGWGNLADNGKSSNVLMKVNLKVIPLEECASNYKSPIDLVKPHQLCTRANGKDACQGDSGGPVTWLDPETNMYTLVGVVSYGKGCASGVPGVNTDVYSYLDWILENMSEYTKLYFIKFNKISSIL